VFGLALGLSGILFITLFLKNELSYDAWHTKSERIYRFTTKNPAFLNDSHFAREINSWQVAQIEIPKGKITGVVQDFHLSSIKNKVRPLVLFKRKNLWMINKEIIRKMN
jgi:hypothetical protein